MISSLLSSLRFTPTIKIFWWWIPTPDPQDSSALTSLVSGLSWILLLSKPNPSILDKDFPPGNLQNSIANFLLKEYSMETINMLDLLDLLATLRLLLNSTKKLSDKLIIKTASAQLRVDLKPSSASSSVSSTKEMRSFCLIHPTIATGLKFKWLEEKPSESLFSPNST